MGDGARPIDLDEEQAAQAAKVAAIQAASVFLAGYQETRVRTRIGCDAVRLPNGNRVLILIDQAASRAELIPLPSEVADELASKLRGSGLVSPDGKVL